ncbi:MAG: xylose isomerase [SAR116 cluster bacterium MED-G04]|nr:xylose isomerase [SAR116 cluster bacterium]OUW36941.1 MAG: xylose isomerase [Gammaproteobacteria bacterium TMED183]PDH65330.1 MAG: xylose isomerase [SAR116 cluster bacterium MED-G04]HCD49019.1 xylose isomerase [Alphaproteobacteria bacterium]MAI00987.1 xylose isomerase [SAR116 cluster bacterium]
MMPHDDSGTVLPYEDICHMVADAGYDGMAIDLGAGDVAQAREVYPIMQRVGLTPLIVAFPKTIESLRETLIMSKDFGAPFVDVIGQVMPITVDGMIPVIRRWMDMADEVGIPVQFETHRNCITNDLFSTLALLDAIPEMRLCADLSHFVVDREFKHPLQPHEMAMISRILNRSDSFQGRVASRQQVQLQLDFPQHQKWVDLFRGWWREGLADWRNRNDDGDCIFLCELGPPEYAMTDANGREMSNRWLEALTIREWVSATWNDLELAGG